MPSRTKLSTLLATALILTACAMSAVAQGDATLLAGKAKASVTRQPNGDKWLNGLAKYGGTPDLKTVVAFWLASRPNK